MPTPWFETNQADRVATVAIVFAALVIPFSFGLLARSWRWVIVCGSVAEVSVIVGALVGAIVARQMYPEFYAHGGGANSVAAIALFGGVFGIILAAAPASASAAIGTAVGRWWTRRPRVRHLAGS